MPAKHKVHRKRQNVHGKGLFDFLVKLALRPLGVISKLAGGGSSSKRWCARRSHHCR